MITSRNISIAICDDDKNDLDHIGQMVLDYIQTAEVGAQIFCYNSADELLRNIKFGMEYNLFLLDVMLGASDGISVAAKLRDINQHAEIIFISSNREMALYGYEVAAARYLAKPVKQTKLTEALNFCVERLTANRSVLLPTESGQCAFDISVLQYVESWDGFSRIHLNNGDIEIIKLKFYELLQLLPPKQFAQIHRTLVVNLEDIHYIRRSEIELRNGEKLPVSKYRINELRTLYLEYMEK